VSRRKLEAAEESPEAGDLQATAVAWRAEVLARQWEAFARARLGRHVSVIDLETRKIKSRYAKAFSRVLAYASANQISPPDVYFTLLGEGFRTGGVRFSTNLLGGRFYNELVERGRAMRREQFSGREDSETLAYRAVRSEAPRESADSLRSECRKFLALRGQYAHFPRGRFWLFFVGEFSGTFLHASDDYRDSGLDLLLHLTEVQIKEWKSLDGDPRLAASVKRTALALLSAEESHATSRDDHRSDAPPAPRVLQGTRGGRG